MVLVPQRQGAYHHLVFITTYLSLYHSAQQHQLSIRSLIKETLKEQLRFHDLWIQNFYLSGTKYNYLELTLSLKF